jgi:hypothetical protein
MTFLAIRAVTLSTGVVRNGLIKFQIEELSPGAIYHHSEKLGACFEISPEQQGWMLDELRRCRYGYLLALQILLLIAKGKTPTAIADFLCCSRSTRPGLSSAGSHNIRALRFCGCRVITRKPIRSNAHLGMFTTSARAIIRGSDSIG